MEAQTTYGKLTVVVRSKTGKENARKLRASGMIPGVLYGPSTDPVSLALDPVALTKSLDPDKGRNTVLELTIEGEGGSKTTAKVMLKDLQIDSLSQDMLHADFVEVSLEKRVRVHVPLELTGKPVGVKAGGTLHQVFRTVDVECTPERIPSELTAEVTHLEMGDTLSIGEIKLPAGVTICLPPEQTCAQVYAPRAATAEEEAEGEEAAGEEGAEGAEESAAGDGEDKDKDKDKDKKDKDK